MGPRISSTLNKEKVVMEPSFRGFLGQNETFFENVVRTLKQEGSFNQFERNPRWLTWATGLYMLYGSTLPMVIMAALLNTKFLLPKDGFPDRSVPYATTLAFLAGANFDRREWRYVMAALAKQGVDFANEQRARAPDEVGPMGTLFVGFYSIFTFLLGWFCSFAYRRVTKKK